LQSEILDAVRRGVAGSLIKGPSIFPSPGESVTQFYVTDEFPFVSLISKISPSPDWFTGVTSCSLKRGGFWIRKKIIHLYPFDAGTDSGINYLSENLRTQIQDPISKIKAVPFKKQEPIGKFVFELIN
jgi:hypothetical protein